jgi:hypothetical protein
MTANPPSTGGRAVPHGLTYCRVACCRRVTAGKTCPLRRGAKLPRLPSYPDFNPRARPGLSGAAPRGPPKSCAGSRQTPEISRLLATLASSAAEETAFSDSASPEGHLRHRLVDRHVDRPQHRPSIVQRQLRRVIGGRTQAGIWRDVVPVARGKFPTPVDWTTLQAIDCSSSAPAAGLGAAVFFPDAGLGGRAEQKNAEHRSKQQQGEQDSAELHRATFPVRRRRFGESVTGAKPTAYTSSQAARSAQCAPRSSRQRGRAGRAARPGRRD